MTGIQLCLLYVRLGTYLLFLYCARLITPLVEAQRAGDIQLRHTVYAFAFLLAVDYRSCRHRRVVQQGFRVFVVAAVYRLL